MNEAAARSPEMSDTMPGTPRDVKFWACTRDQELLTATTIADAIQERAVEIYPHSLPETITVYGYAPMELPSAKRIAERMLDDLCDYLDDEYGNQVDGGPTEIPDALRSAALPFAKAVRAHYPVWSCEQVTQQIVNVRDYLTAAESTR